MITATLDQICRRGLLESSLPIHFYLEYLLHSATCLRELTFDTLKIYNFANLVIDDTGNAVLPDDFVEDISCCLPAGQSLIPLPKQKWITPIRIHDSTGAFVPYSDQAHTDNTNFFGFPLIGTTWFWNVSSFGEPTGGFYGARGGTNSGYQVFKQQRRIQLSEGLSGTNIVLIYVSDGSSIDNATQIDPQAFSTVTAFINWKISPNRDNKDSPEGRNYTAQRRLLVARLDDLDCPTVRNILHNAYSATVKN